MPEETQTQPINTQQKKLIIRLIIIISILIILPRLHPFDNTMSWLFHRLSRLISPSPYEFNRFVSVEMAFHYLYFLLTLSLNIWLLIVARRLKNRKAFWVSIGFFIILLLPLLAAVTIGILFCLHPSTIS